MGTDRCRQRGTDGYTWKEELNQTGLLGFPEFSAVLLQGLPACDPKLVQSDIFCVGRRLECGAIHEFFQLGGVDVSPGERVLGPDDLATHRKSGRLDSVLELPLARRTSGTRTTTRPVSRCGGSC